jgi:penicillin-binding protein 1B
MAERKPQKAKPSKREQFSNFFRSPLFKVLLSIFLFFFIGTSALVLYYYNYYSRIIDRKLSGEVFKNTAQIYAAPFRIYPGQRMTVEEVVARLQRAGFEPGPKTAADDGTYEVSGAAITIRPRAGDTLRLEFGKGLLTRILKPVSGEASEAWLPAELVTNLYDESREKRRLVDYKDLPKVFVDALIAAEDQHFFTHWGIDPKRLVGAVLYSVRDSERIGGTSTITQQLARNLFLTVNGRTERSLRTLSDTLRTLRRKATEIFISFLLEQRLTKQQILTLYANETYMGQRGSFSINGFGEAAAAYFGKDLSALTLPEAATLAGIIPAPNGKYSPIKHPDEVKKRRNLVLAAMRAMGSITDKQFEQAKNAELKVIPLKIDASDAPYFVDYIREELLKNFSEEEITTGSLRVYTSLDPALQKIAVDAVHNGLNFANEQIAARTKRQKAADNLPGPQAALIALDPHTGEIKAMVGGSDYAASQLNRIVQAFRQPGSIFKPFVYAAALETAFDADRSEQTQSPDDTANDGDASQTERPREHDVITPITTLVDEPTTFVYDNGRTYEPNNYHQEYRGTVTVRTALQHSLNVPTIKLAERIGYNRVAAMAKRLGLNAKIKGYPSVALGAFEVTPLEMAGAYTAFANEGRRIQPHALLRVTSADGSVNKAYKFEPQQVLRPELAYLMTNLMEGVINSGTGAGVRARGFTLPAAGKTGTSRDGWFAGYTKDLLVIAWMGYDDNRDLNLEGARSALPIWTEFMLKATKLYPPGDPDRTYFDAPPGIEFVRIDSGTLQRATDSCPDTFEEAFIAGTAPTTYCTLHGLKISDAIEKTVAEPAKEVSRGLGKIFRGVFGGIFGSNKDK